MATRLRPTILAFCLASAVSAVGAAPPETGTLSPDRVAAVRAYIKKGWTTLTRSTRDLAKAAPDPKVPRPAGQPWPVYVPAREDRARLEADLKTTMTPEDLARIELRTLPTGTGPGGTAAAPPIPACSTCRARTSCPAGASTRCTAGTATSSCSGLLRDGETERARDMVDNFLYEIEHYGTILNANRTYYLTRSQPPFLTRMVLGVYEQTGDKAWLRATRAGHREATTASGPREPHLIPATGLSRYLRPRRRTGAGGGQRREGRRRGAPTTTGSREYFKAHRTRRRDYDVSRYYDRDADRLTAALLQGRPLDARVGLRPVEPLRPLQRRRHPLRAGLPEHAALPCWRRTRRGSTTIAGRRRGGTRLAARADARRPPSTATCGTRRRGLYLDYNFETGAAAPLPVRDHVLPAVGGPRVAGAGPPRAREPAALRAPGRAAHQHATSPATSGTRRSAGRPCSCSPVDGLRRYGYRRRRRPHGARVPRPGRQGVRASTAPSSRSTTCAAASPTSRPEIRFGYAANQIGFGWTNAAYLDLLSGLERKPVRPRRVRGGRVASAGAFDASAAGAP